MKIIDIYYSHGSCGTMRDMTKETEWIKEALVGKEVENNRDAEKALSEFFKSHNYHSVHIHCSKSTYIGWNIVIG
jgi:hypothetical protein